MSSGIFKTRSVPGTAQESEGGNAANDHSSSSVTENEALKKGACLRP